MKTSVKICGLTRECDVDAAMEYGAAYFGFIVYSKSARCCTVQRAKELARRVPEGRGVLVDVAPGPDRVRELARSGFENFQIHTELNVGNELDKWADLLGRERLWLAPRLKHGEALPERFLQMAETFLMDTYSSNQVGGTGQTGDWAGFSRLRLGYPDKRWILAGGLNPGNIREALEESGARQVDVSSGVETAPGVKDSEKIRELFDALSDRS